MKERTIVMYYRLVLREESQMEKTFGNEYIEYKRRVPAFVSKLKRRIHILTDLYLQVTILREEQNHV
jgi:hypothetical protein